MIILTWLEFINTCPILTSTNQTENFCTKKTVKTPNSNMYILNNPPPSPVISCRLLYFFAYENHLILRFSVDFRIHDPDPRGINQNPKKNFGSQNTNLNCYPTFKISKWFIKFQYIKL